MLKTNKTLMQLFSIGNLYIGKDNESFTDISIHLGRLRVEYSRPHFSKDDGYQPSKGINR